ncbi:glycosyltransferase family 2 protein [Paenibacillus oceani]|uniref:Glycosyltransferase family 2 protein n=1 Tax=Paenibacillus oceani TaxID=2772510 RepID=A0A927CJ06_9BACL|nr:glycosyltransferase family 2 protein [Paenibacillus oceani]MBD2866786.1 glycosyltransferase family 2 protein [Paenibacillus oceani]
MEKQGHLPVLGIVVPCYNEEEVLPETVSQLTRMLERLVREKLIADGSFMLFVDDGSRDRTWELIEKYRSSNPRVSGLKLARNVGHQNALLAGLNRARNRVDCAVSIDADLQDDPEVIREFMIKYHEGFDIVYGIRQSRETDTAFKRSTAQTFYKLMRKMGADIEYNHADYRLMSKRALEQLERFKEVNLFLRGIVPMIGFNTTRVYFDRKERFAGESKYPLKKMLAFAWDGITSLSVTPIRLVTAAGFILFLISVVAALYSVIQKLAGNTVTGWTSLMLSLWFIGGIQLISLGLIGEYIGKIYKEVKRRPLYIVDKDLHAASESESESDNRTSPLAASDEPRPSDLGHGLGMRS